MPQVVEMEVSHACTFACSLKAFLDCIRTRWENAAINRSGEFLEHRACTNDVWSMDFVFDRIASGRVLKCLTIVDDATHEAVAVIPEYSIGGEHLTRLLDEVCARRGKPAIIRTDNGKEFTGKALLTWAHRNDVALRLIDPGKPTRTPTSSSSTAASATSA